MRKLILGLGIFIVAVVVLALVVPNFIPAEFYRGRIASAVEAATGRQVQINGPVQVTVFPNIGVEANDIAFANAPSGVAKDMATLAKLEVGLKLLPLIAGNIEIDRFILTDPVIHLEIDKNGHPNWEFTPATVPGGTPPAASVPRNASAPEQAEALQQLRLGEVKLVNGTIDYFDARTNARQALSKVGVTVKLPDLDRQSSADGSLDWHGKTVKLEVSLDRPRALFGKAQSAAKATISADPVKLTFEGTATGEGGNKPVKLAGALALDVPSVRDLATWSGTPVAAGGKGLGAFSLKGNLAAAGPSFAFSNAAISLDAMKGTGDLSVDTVGARPAIKGKLDVDTLDLNPYLAQPAKAASTAPAAPGSPQAAAPDAWSDAPIDLGALKVADVNFAVGAGAIRYEKIELGKSALTLTVKDGRLNADLSQLALYGGSGKGQLALDATGSVPALDANFTLNGVQAQSALAAIVDLDRVTGVGNFDFALNSRGRSQRELIGSLGGKGGFAVKDGAIKGIDLAAMAQNVQQAFVQAVAGGAQQTAFSELSGHFTITNGIVKNDDLTLKSPAVQLAGSGTVDLPQQTIDYRLQPMVSVNAQNLMVPVVIRGPWSKVSYEPDLQALLAQKLGKPGNLLQGLKGAIAPGSAGTGSSSKPPSKPADILKGIFGK